MVRKNVLSCNKHSVNWIIILYKCYSWDVLNNPFLWKGLVLTKTVKFNTLKHLEIRRVLRHDWLYLAWFLPLPTLIRLQTQEIHIQMTSLRASKIAQRVEGLTASLMTWADPWNPHSGRRQLTPASCLLTTEYALWHKHACAQVHIQ